MNILVNNSYSGDRVTNLGQTRCEQLHDDTGVNTGTNPDIIAVYLGINDFDNGVETTTFATQYDAMIKKIVEKYNNSSIETTSTDTANSDDTTTKTTADIYLFTLLPNAVKVDETRLLAYNEAIRSVASKYGCHIVDLYADSGITRVNMASYTGDTDCLHPNPAGMTLMAECFVDALYTNYVTDKS